MLFSYEDEDNGRLLADFQICISMPLIENNMRNIFLERSYTKCGGGASPTLFYKTSKLSIHLYQQSEM